jgi:hypothetical protein
VKTCACCERRVENGDKYCREHADGVLLHLRSMGYLTEVPGPGAYRPLEAREDTYENKYGRDE